MYYDDGNGAGTGAANYNCNEWKPYKLSAIACQANVCSIAFCL